MGSNRKRPFGYRMEFGEVVLHPAEAETVRWIYDSYLAGASYNALVDKLQERGIPYDGNKPWNKNMAARILADRRYTGEDGFPQIIPEGQFHMAQVRRQERASPCKKTLAQKFCTQSPTLDEEPLQQAILAAVNAVMLDRDTLARQLAAVMEWELAPMLGESMSLADIDRALEELSGRFNSLLAEASANPSEDYTERFRELSESTARLKEKKARLEGACREQGVVQNRLLAVSAAMEHMTAALTEWDEEVIHQLLEKVTVLSREKIRVTFRDGREIEQAVNQPKRRCITA